MAKINVSGFDDLRVALRNELKSLVSGLADEVESIAKSNTPIKTGNARNNWKKSVSPDTFVVSNRVPYIQRLEDGSSKQAPRGIIGPTLTQIKGKQR
jgi:hypothetical protein